MMGQFPICNHKKETAPKLFGKAFPLCWRCSGVFLAFQVMGILNLIGAVKYPAPRGWVFDPRGIRQISAQARLLGSLLAGINSEPIHVKLGVLLCVPMALDGGIQYFFNIRSNNIRRFLSGFLFGIGAAQIVLFIF